MAEVKKEKKMIYIKRLKDQMKYFIGKKDRQRAKADRNRSTPLEDMLERNTQK